MVYRPWRIILRGTFEDQHVIDAFVMVTDIHVIDIVLVRVMTLTEPFIRHLFGGAITAVTRQDLLDASYVFSSFL
jgi:hypothetical protein